MRTLFGTDGIRGTANREPFVPETLARVGRALGAALLAEGLPPRVLIGRDTRRSGPMVGAAVVSGLLASGVSVTAGGVLPTPAVARLTRSGPFGLGVVVSASHNPAPDNGLKLFTAAGRKAGRRFEEKVTARLDGRPPSPLPHDPGTWASWPEAGERYLESVLGEFGDLSLEGLTVVADCAHGAMAEVAPRALRRLGARVHAIGVKPTGRNINRRVGATHPGAAARETVRRGADLGITFDGDGDRVLFADERGRVLDGDAIMAVLARDLLSRRALARRTVVATVMSNVGLEQSLAEIGCRLVRTDVGDRHVVEEMARGGYRLGGEQSGHLVVRRRDRLIGDGLETALHLLRALRRSGRKLSGLASCFRRSPQHLTNVRVSEKPDLSAVQPVAEEIRKVESELGAAGRVLVRYSGTEPLARVMVEGPEAAATKAAAERIARRIAREIGTSS